MIGRDPRAWTCTTRRRARCAPAATDDIACWFIDTDYDGESFFVRHAYFTGADEPYEQAEAGAAGGDRRGGVVDAVQHRRAARSTAPETGKIAVKVINHYGDEVLKVYEV